MSVDGPSIATGGEPDRAEDGPVSGAATATLAISMGIAVPAAVFGKAVLGVALVPAVAVVLMALVRSRFRQMVLRAALGPTGLAFALFCGVALISVLTSEHTLKSLEAWARTAAFMLFGLAATHMLATDRNALDLARRGLLLATIVALAYVVVAIFVTEAVLALIALGTEIRQPLSLNFKWFASAVVCLAPVALWAASGPGLLLKALRLGLLVLAAMAIWLDGREISRAAILGIVAAAVLLGVVGLVGRLSRRARALAVAGLLASAIASATAVTVSLPKVQGDGPLQFGIPESLVDGHRQIIWAFTVDATKQNPVFGHGPNSINMIEGANERIPRFLAKSLRGRATFLPSHPHNWIYEIASETGLVGLVALCIGLVLLLRRAMILALNGSRAGWAVVALFGAFWGSSLVNFSIWSAWWQLTFIVLLSILMAAASPSVPRAQR